jgi:hypothetical protein
MTMIEIIISAGITFIALVLLIVSLLSYWKYRRGKLILISGVFLLMFIRGTILSTSLFYPEYKTWLTSPYIWGFDLVILLILYIASIKR